MCTGTLISFLWWNKVTSQCREITQAFGILRDKSKREKDTRKRGKGQGGKKKPGMKKKANTCWVVQAHVSTSYKYCYSFIHTARVRK